MLPNFLIIGANKAGTTSVHRYLQQHPDIFMSANKEPMYFVQAGKDVSTNTAEQKQVLTGAITTLEAYEALFEESEGATAIGESSTAYLANPQCSDLIQATIPDVKLVAILRNPVERAFSNYRMYSRWGFEKRSFRAAIKDEISGRSAHLPQGQKYLQLGKYFESLSIFTSKFGKDRVQVSLYDSLVEDSASVLQEICKFLGARPDFQFDTSTRHNADRAPDPKSRFLKLFSNKPAIANRERKILLEYFISDITSLEGLLDVDLSIWKSS